MKVRGTSSLVGTLNKISQSPRASTVDRVARAALQPMKKAAEANAKRLRQRGKKRPKGGHLDEGIRIQSQKRGGGRRKRTTKLGMGTDRARRIGHLVELGTSPHWQPYRNGGIWHPGARPKPFMRTAYDMETNTVLHEFQEMIWDAIADDAAKARGTRRRR